MLFGLLKNTRRPSPTPSRPSLEALEDRLCPSGGVLDPTFGGGTGEVSFPWATSNISTSVAIQPDGKIVSAWDVQTSKGTDEMIVMRLNSNGSLDTSFNGTGYVDLKVGVWADSNVVALQPDGKVLIGGSAYPTTKALQGYTDTEFVVARLNSNGTLDSTFANRGIFTWDPYSSTQDWVQALAVLSDGGIAVLGANNNTSVGGMVFKLSAGGVRISSFAGGAAVLNPLSGTSLTGLAVAPNGDLIVSGAGRTTSGSSDGLLFAVNPSTGTLDPSFNNGQGWLAAADPAAGYTAFNAVTIQGNDIVTAGYAWNSTTPHLGLLARFSLSGALDTGFANGGYFTLTSGVNNYPNSNFINISVATEPDGSLVVGGTCGYLVVGHLTADGQLDTTFGGAGTGFITLGGGPYGFGLAIDASGRILTSGYTGPNVVNQRMAFFARLTPPEAMIGSFTASANPVASGGSETLTASNIANSSTITQVAFYANGTLLGYGSQTSPGVWTFTFIVNLVPGSYTLTAQAEDSAGVLGDPFALTLTVQ
jgi:uncharacterized delta-60 repeat protein